jgi:hypothetical protein
MSQIPLLIVVAALVLGIQLMTSIIDVFTHYVSATLRKPGSAAALSRPLFFQADDAQSTLNVLSSKEVTGLESAQHPFM